MRKIDSLIIADTHLERALALKEHVLEMPDLINAQGVTVLFASAEEEAIKSVGNNFNKIIREALRGLKSSTVIMDDVLATRGGILEILKAAEKRYQAETRRIVLTSKSSSDLKKDLGRDSSLIYRVPYNGDDRNDYLDVLDDRLRDQVSYQALKASVLG